MVSERGLLTVVTCCNHLMEYNTSQKVIMHYKNCTHTPHACRHARTHARTRAHTHSLCICIMHCKKLHAHNTHTPFAYALRIMHYKTAHATHTLIMHMHCALRKLHNHTHTLCIQFVHCNHPGSASNPHNGANIPHNGANHGTRQCADDVLNVVWCYWYCLVLVWCFGVAWW